MFLNQLAAEFSFSTPSAPPSTYAFKQIGSFDRGITRIAADCCKASAPTLPDANPCLAQRQIPARASEYGYGSLQGGEPRCGQTTTSRTLDTSATTPG